MRAEGDMLIFRLAGGLEPTAAAPKSRDDAIGKECQVARETTLVGPWIWRE